MADSGLIARAGAEPLSDVIPGLSLPARARVPDPKFARLLSKRLCELRVQKGHWNHSVCQCRSVRKFASAQAYNSGELPNRDSSGAIDYWLSSSANRDDPAIPPPADFAA
jgi:hypothetical protein